MDRANQLFIFFCFMVFFFTGCKKPGSSSVGVKGPKGGAQSALNQKQETQKKDITELRGLLAESDTLFTQVWQVIAKKKDQNPSNAFRVVNDLLREAQKTSAENPQNLKTKTTKTDEKKKAEAPTATESNSPTVKLVVKEVKPKDGLPYTDYQLFFVPPKSNLKDQPYVAHFIKINGSFWKIVINPMGFTDELNGFGPLIDLELDKKQAMVSCEMTPSPQGRLTRLNCGEMGQDIDDHRFFSLSSFFLNLENLKKPLQVYGKILNSSTREEKSIEIQDFKELNELLVKERVISRGEDEEAPPTSTQPVRNDGSTESSANTENSGPKEENKNQESQQTQTQEQRNDGSLVVDSVDQGQQPPSVVTDGNAGNENFNDRRFSEQQEREEREKERRPNEDRGATPRSSNGEAPPPPEAVT